MTARKRVVDNRTPTYASAIVRLLDAFDGLGSDAERLVLAAHAESLTGIQK
ncbi:hypothetical protein BN1012_Phect960 [Candidatus Phaeomarinobacter ectocarpi]|uniref:Uncharacterized protein n=1 Tax=Candidatus Phaeomarinibacter ectocarpi TaxID=1458461 RepID=X5MED9_9HYPH|nr:hypothetical protein BN1012_Phect960 [Candidatus Phaeomarinobacter ectocarpi]